jgi:predicted O-methyltransferase YrrM
MPEIGRSCVEEQFRTNEGRFRLPTSLWLELESLQHASRRRGVQVLGNFSYFPLKCEKLLEWVARFQPRTVVEVGLNCGHSAALVISVVPDVTMISFDLGDRDYINYAAETIRENHLKTFEYVKGDSKVTLAPRLSTLEAQIDFALVDGDHTYTSSLSDLTAILPKVSPNGAVVVDDFEIEGIAKAVQEACDTFGFEIAETVTAERYSRDKESVVVLLRRKQ